MKKIYLLLIMCICMLVTPVKVSGYEAGIESSDVVTDRAQLLADTQEEMLRNRINSIYNKYDIQIVIVTTNSLYGKSCEAFTDDYYDYNGFAEDGICIMRNPTSKDLYISTSGEGIDILNDDAIDFVLDSMVPLVKGERFYDACDDALDRIENYIADYNGESVDVEYPGMSSYKSAESKKDNFMLVLMAMGISLAITIITIATLRSNMNTAVKQTRSDNYADRNSFVVSKSSDIYLYSRVAVVPKAQTNSGSRGGSSVHRGSSGRSHGGGGRKC